MTLLTACSGATTASVRTPLEKLAAREACSKLRPLLRAADEATDSKRSAMAKDVLDAARRAGDEDLIDAAQRLASNVNTNDLDTWEGLFRDMGNACRAVGATA